MAGRTPELLYRQFAGFFLQECRVGSGTYVRTPPLGRCMLCVLVLCYLAERLEGRSERKDETWQPRPNAA